MLNTFPDLLVYSQLASFILRVVLGFLLIELGILKFKGERMAWITSFQTLKLNPAPFLVSLYGFLQIIGGLFLVVGFWTQPAALAFVILTGIELYIEYKEGPVLKRDLVFYVLVFAIALSLLLTGAGAYAVDIPL